MIKPEHLKPGDKVAIVSLSGGLIGEKNFIHKYNLAKERLEKDFKLKVVHMPNALKGIEFLYAHPEKRAEDLMSAFKDKSIKAIFNAIGGDDSIRLLPFIDFEVIKNNPKIFTGFSDTTVVHFMLRKAGLMSYYGAAVMNNWAEYVKINDYTLSAINETFFFPKKRYEIKNAGVESFSADIVPWGEENMNKARKFYPDEHGYEVLQGKGTFSGRLIGGCLDSFLNIMGTKIWPRLSEFKNKILCIEMCAADESMVEVVLRNLQAQGVLDVISGMIVGKPQQREMYEKYKKTILKIVSGEAKKTNLPILYNVNFGHAEPIGVLPLGAKCQVDLNKKEIHILESPTK